MQLAKRVIDVGLSTNRLEPMLRFWQQDAGLRFDHVLPIRRGQKQYRHDADGSVIKLNHLVETLPTAPPSGYRELIIARPPAAAMPRASARGRSAVPLSREKALRPGRYRNLA